MRQNRKNLAGLGTLIGGGCAALTLTLHLLGVAPWQSKAEQTLEPSNNKVPAHLQIREPLQSDELPENYFCDPSKVEIRGSNEVRRKVRLWKRYLGQSLDREALQNLTGKKSESIDELLGEIFEPFQRKSFDEAAPTVGKVSHSYRDFPVFHVAPPIDWRANPHDSRQEFPLPLLQP